MRYALSLLILLVAAPAHAFNALGHKVIADIAWQQLDAPTRRAIVATLRRHPRFDDDFAKEMPSDAEEERRIFQQAAIWPDIARGFRGEDLATYNRGTWHYVNFPYFIDGTPAPPGLNLTALYPTPLPAAAIAPPYTATQFLTPPEIACRLRVSPTKVHGWIRRGELGR